MTDEEILQAVVNGAIERFVKEDEAFRKFCIQMDKTDPGACVSGTLHVLRPEHFVAWEKHKEATKGQRTSRASCRNSGDCART